MIIVTGNGKIIYMGERVSVSLDRLMAWILKLICELVLLFCRFFGDFNTHEGWNKFSLFINFENFADTRQKNFTGKGRCIPEYIHDVDLM
jgi:hypothetical protein